MSQRIEQRARLRREDPLTELVVLVRGGRDTIDKLARHAARTARAWSLDGQPLFGISVFAVLDRSVDALLQDRFASFRTVHMTSAGQLRAAGFELLPTGLSPHFTIRLPRTGDEGELAALLAVLGPARDNAHYGRFGTWREEG